MKTKTKAYKRDYRRNRKQKCPWTGIQGHFTELGFLGLGDQTDHIGLAIGGIGPGGEPVPGDVPFPMPIATDKPLFVEAGGMLGNTREVHRFVCRRLFRHSLSALCAKFSRHCFLLIQFTELGNAWLEVSTAGFNFGNALPAAAGKRKMEWMQDDKVQEPQEATQAPATDWADLRAQAAKLGISLSQLQQLNLEKKMRLARKSRVSNAPVKDGSPVEP